MSEAEKEYQLWLKKVQEDEAAAEAILETSNFPAPVCFHSQQMVEKLLKAVLVFYNRKFRKIHDLVILANQCKKFISDIDEYKDDITLLNRYYVESRYPGDYPEFTLKECQQALEAAKRVKGFVLKKIK